MMPLECRRVPETTKPFTAAQLDAGARLALIGVAANFVLAVIKIVADDTTAIGLTTMQCTARNGNAYSNEYAWQLEFSGGKIKSVREFTDSLRFARLTGISG